MAAAAGVVAGSVTAAVAENAGVPALNVAAPDDAPSLLVARCSAKAGYRIEAVTLPADPKQG